MILGFLHLGPPAHGVRRFGQLLAREAQQRPELTVLDVELALSGDARQDLSNLKAAARTLSAADIVQIQFTEEIWGPEFHQFRNLWQFVRCCRAPIAVTIHDTEPPTAPPPRSRVQTAKQTAKRWLYQAGWVKHWEPGNRWIRQWLRRHTRLTIVCTTEEQQRLEAKTPSSPVTVIPHFIESRSHLPDREAARQALGLQNHRVVTLLGFIFGGKGHHLLLQALSLLPDPDLLVVFAGGVAPGSDAILADLKAVAQQLQVSDRLRITGYLEEPVLEQYLMATDVPVCPFEVCFASGSLATWLSAGRRVLTSDLPQFQAYNQLEPGCLSLFNPYTPQALATAMTSMLARPEPDGFPAIQRLRDRLSLANAFEQHLHVYRQALTGLPTGRKRLL